MMWMAYRFREGDTIPKDPVKAHDWLLKAALQNKNEKIKNLAFEALGETNHPPISGTEPASAKPNDVAGAVVEAEKRANFNTCVGGRYPALCNHSKLTSSEKSQVLDAEKAVNLERCMDGRYPALCDHSLLEKTDKRK